jgi:hypothetical protein
MNVTEIRERIEEPKYTSEELAKLTKLHPSMIRKMFIDQPGVIRIGHTGTGKKRQYFTLRIPASVAARVLGELTVGGPRLPKVRT